jgi:hypothetical protein
MTGFECFAADIGNPPTASHSLDRIKNDQGYFPGNVRWATPREQAMNRSSNRIITAFGRSLPLAQWSHETKISEASIRYRIVTAKMDAETALSKPMRPNKRSKPQ